MTSSIHSSESLGRLIRDARRAQGLTQAELAGASEVGVRFIVDLEKGKPTCELEKSLRVLRMLGGTLTVELPGEGT